MVHLKHATFRYTQVTSHFSQNLVKWQGNESTTFWERSIGNPDPDLDQCRNPDL